MAGLSLKERLNLLKIRQSNTPKMDHRDVNSESNCFEKISTMDIRNSYNELFSKQLLLRERNFKIASFDTETTGLSGGAGTYIFLAGFSYWKSEYEIETHQFFLSEFSDEPEFLQKIQEKAENFEQIISYNGASFDLPLFRTRQIMNGIPPSYFVHRDLLYVSRRFWKYIIGSCSLRDIEREILAFNRIGDIPSFLIPSLYFENLSHPRGPETDSMKAVFSHHAMDMESLLVLESIISGIEKFELLVKPESQANKSDLKISDRAYLLLIEGNLNLKSFLEDLLSKKMSENILEEKRLYRRAWVIAGKLGERELRMKIIKRAGLELQDTKAQMMKAFSEAQ